mgnify:CR=1 FL=1
MTFDVINYTYSGLISIFSMIMGMAYPLINTAITEIDTKYGGNRMSEKVLSESIYIRFRAILAISIVVSILTPFVLYYLKGISDWKFYWVLLQTIVILLLVISFIQLYDLIIRYKLPKKFLAYNSRKDDGKKDVVYLAEIARYAARQNDLELYLHCTTEVGGRLLGELQNGKIQSTLSPFYANSYWEECRLTKESREALAIFISIVCDKNIKDGMYRVDCSLLNLFFNTNKPLLAGDRQIIWRTVQEAARNGNDEFVKQYWVYAVQYYSLFDISRNFFGVVIEQRRELEKEKEVFHKFHTALLGMLLYLDRKKCLTNLLYYSRTLPYSYPLCCNSLQGIFDEWKRFFSNDNTMLLMLQMQDYPLVGNDHGVDSERFLLHVMERMLAIQILRLKGIGYNVEHHDPLDNIVTGNTIEEKSESIVLLERMKMTINEICSKGLETILEKQVYFTKEEALDLIEKNIQRIKKDIKDKEVNPSIDDQKFNAIWAMIHRAWNNADMDLGEHRGNVAYNTERYEREIRFDIPKEMVCIGYKQMKNDGFVDTLIGALVYSVKGVKAEAFKKINPVTTYRIEYQDLGLALERLRLSSEYVVLYNSINIDLYYKCYKQYKGYRVDASGLRFLNEALLIEQHDYESKPYMLVLKRDDLPYLTIEKNGDDDYSDEEQRFIETNIETNPANIESLSQRYIKAIVGLHYPKELRYIRIDIPYILSDMDIDKIRPIISLLG